MMRRAVILAAALLILPVQGQAQSSFLKKAPAPPPAPAKPTPSPPAPPAAKPVAVKPAATPAPASKPAVATSPAKPIAKPRPVKAAPVNSVPPMVTSAIAVLGAQCRQVGGTPNGSDALLSADLNDDGLKDYVIYEGRMACAGAESFYAPTADAGQKATLFLTQKGGNAVAVWSDQNVWDASLVKRGPRTVLSLDVGGVECPGRPSGSGANMAYCTRELGVQGGRWGLGPIVPKTVVANAAPPRILTVEETATRIVRSIHLSCDVAKAASLGTDDNNSVVYEVVCQNKFGYLLMNLPPNGYSAMNCLYAQSHALIHCKLMRREELDLAIIELNERQRPDCKYRDVVATDMTIPVGEETYRVKCGSLFGPSYTLKVNNRAP